MGREPSQSIPSTAASQIPAMSEDKPAATTSSVTLERADAADKKDKVCGSCDGRVYASSFNADLLLTRRKRSQTADGVTRRALPILRPAEAPALTLCVLRLGAGTAMPLTMLTFKSMFETLGAADGFDGASLNADKIRFVVWFMLGVVGPIYGDCTVLYFMPVEYLGHATPSTTSRTTSKPSSARTSAGTIRPTRRSSPPNSPPRWLSYRRASAA